MEISFQEVEERDLPVLTEIYNYYIINSTATFHKHPLSIDEMEAQLFFSDPRCRSFKVVCDSRISGYCLLKRFHVREAYDGTAEVTVYLDPQQVGRGLGSKAVRFIEEWATKQGFHVLVACICGENQSSIRVFEKNGYQKCGHLKEVGYKFDRLLDMVYYQKII